MNGLQSASKFCHHLQELANCSVCPRNCRADRLSGRRGVCGSDASFGISSICIHRGEEPAISGENGICNIFFSHCNLKCAFCQNWQISRPVGAVGFHSYTLEELTAEICSLLDQGCHAVGFVSPSHYVPHVKCIIDALRSMNRNPVFIYNSNGYDSVGQLRGLENYIDIYLPDFKYSDSVLAKELSGAKDYPEIALNALKEMYRQKGSTLRIDDAGIAESGLIIRHLILPGFIDNSIGVLNLIADHLSPSVAISLMSQYWPTPAMKDHPSLSRTLTKEEYDQVVEVLENLGFYKGWVQELESSRHYLPDFNSEHPFEGN